MSAADGLVPMDDALCGRLRTCTLCGVRLRVHGWFDIWTGATIAVAVLLCSRCRDAECEHPTLSAFMEQRYAVERQGEVPAGASR